MDNIILLWRLVVPNTPEKKLPVHLHISRNYGNDKTRSHSSISLTYTYWCYEEDRASSRINQNQIKNRKNLKETKRKTTQNQQNQNVEENTDFRSNAEVKEARIKHEQNSTREKLKLQTKPTFLGRKMKWNQKQKKDHSTHSSIWININKNKIFEKNWHRLGVGWSNVSGKGNENWNTTEYRVAWINIKQNDWNKRIIELIFGASMGSLQGEVYILFFHARRVRIPILLGIKINYFLFQSIMV